jgi:hypothetical protein
MRPVFWFVLACYATLAYLSCILPAGEEEPAKPAPRVEVPADTCRPPTCYPDPRPPAPPR